MQPITIFSLSASISVDLDSLQIGENTLTESAKAKLREMLALADQNRVLLQAGLGYRYNRTSKEAGALADQLDKLSVEVNRDQLVACLKQAGIAMVEVKYSGSGDSGGVEEIETTPNDIDLAGKSCLRVEIDYGWTKQPACTIKVSLENLEDRLSGIADEMISLFGHDGYENNEGGYGTMTIAAEEGYGSPAGSVNLEHSDIIEATEDYSHRLGEAA